jgi:hypothetical protein
MTRKTYHGSCHCGAVRFTAEIDLDEGIRKCNCTWCVKQKMWKAFSYGDGLHLLSGEDHLAGYQAKGSSWPEGHVHHRFCQSCGVNVFSRGYLEMSPFDGWFHAVNLNAIDDLSPEAIIAAPVIFEDGIHDRQLEAPAETRHL